jgi:hypothetical protein
MRQYKRYDAKEQHARVMKKFLSHANIVGQPLEKRF